MTDLENDYGNLLSALNDKDDDYFLNMLRQEQSLEELAYKTTSLLDHIADDKKREDDFFNAIEIFKNRNDENKEELIKRLKSRRAFKPLLKYINEPEQPSEGGRRKRRKSRRRRRKSMKKSRKSRKSRRRKTTKKSRKNRRRRRR